MRESLLGVSRRPANPSMTQTLLSSSWDWHWLFDQENIENHGGKTREKKLKVKHVKRWYNFYILPPHSCSSTFWESISSRFWGSKHNLRRCLERFLAARARQHMEDIDGYGVWLTRTRKITCRTSAEPLKNSRNFASGLLGPAKPFEIGW